MGVLGTVRRVVTASQDVSEAELSGFVFWARQGLAVLGGLSATAARQDGLMPVGSFLLLSHLLMYTLVFRYLELDFDDTKTAKIATDGLMPSAGMFLLSWILSYNLYNAA